MSYFIDSHCHLHLPWFKINDINKIIEDSLKSQVNKIVSCASDPKNFEFVLNSYEEDRLLCTLGIQPTLADKITDVTSIENHLNNKDDKVKIKAIGEIGLDYHWVKDQSLQKKQQTLFIKSIELSNEYNIPIVIHSRKAESDCLDILEKYANTDVLLHSFEGNKELITRSNDLGYLISIPTNVVIRKSRKKVAKRAGLENIVIETDSPYCAPSEDLFPNTPANIPIAAKKLSTILDCEFIDLMKITSNNAEKFYKI